MLQLLQRAAVGAALFYAQAPAWAQLPPQAQAGDLIFRQGTEAVSHMVRTVDQGLYSHVGLLVGQAGAWQVVHATPSERPGQPDAVVLDSQAFFLAPERGHAFAIYHLPPASAAERQADTDIGGRVRAAPGCGAMGAGPARAALCPARNRHGHLLHHLGLAGLAAPGAGLAGALYAGGYPVVSRALLAAQRLGSIAPIIKIRSCYRLQINVLLVVYSKILFIYKRKQLLLLKNKWGECRHRPWALQPPWSIGCAQGGPAPLARAAACIAR